MKEMNPTEYRELVRSVAQDGINRSYMTVEWATERLAPLGIGPFVTNEFDHGYVVHVSVPVTCQFVYGADTDLDRALMETAKYMELNRKAKTDSYGRIVDIGSIDAEKITVYKGSRNDENKTFRTVEAERARLNEKRSQGLEVPYLTVAELKDKVYLILQDAVVRFNICSNGVRDTVRKLELPNLPEMSTYVVDVPVTGTRRVYITAFSEDQAKRNLDTSIDDNLEISGEPVMVSGEEPEDEEYEDA
jgi:hypothetical protein